MLLFWEMSYCHLARK